jgi:hypothetical protein
MPGGRVGKKKFVVTFSEQERPWLDKSYHPR